MTVLESMACGTPVVVSDIPDYDPLYIEPGVTVQAAKHNDATAVATALLKVLQDPESAATAGRRGEAKSPRDWQRRSSDGPDGTALRGCR